ncbi:peptidoglycan recognition protein family protein [Thermovenabulum sp.]|uniref:peptidoglycan recognition protein family protein n=1 Tax=Thermovenabulum sp. TaxID=3100335 RepID=UPI003C7D37B3
MDRLYPRFIVLHHTAGSDMSALEINRIHAKRGFGVKITSPDYLVKEYIEKGYTATSDGGVIISIGYHYLIRADGKVEPGRPDFAPGAHCSAGDMNVRSIGIALTGNFSSKDNPDGKKGHMKPTDAQIKALKELLIYLMDVYKIPKTGILRHKDVVGAATECPGDRFDFNIFSLA